MRVCYFFKFPDIAQERSTFRHISYKIYGVRISNINYIYVSGNLKTVFSCGTLFSRTILGE